MDKRKILLTVTAAAAVIIVVTVSQLLQQPGKPSPPSPSDAGSAQLSDPVVLPGESAQSSPGGPDTASGAPTANALPTVTVRDDQSRGDRPGTVSVPGTAVGPMMAPETRVAAQAPVRVPDAGVVPPPSAQTPGTPPETRVSGRMPVRIPDAVPAQTQERRADTTALGSVPGDGVGVNQLPVPARDFHEAAVAPEAAAPPLA